MGKPLLSVSDVVRRTGRARRTIQAALLRGDLKAHKLSGATGAWVIDQTDLEDYLARNPREELSE